ncbi:hypothetical protein A2U01_0097971, partial [Trifolium medium]|nr:hypothetical protein [Trifolium medium]
MAVVSGVAARYSEEAG